MIRHEFTGRAAIVTGGARGMGAAVARHLLNGGADVTLWDVNSDLLAATVDRLSDLGSVGFGSVDVADCHDVDRAASVAREAMGRIDILVNCAGIAGPVAPVESFPPDEWERVMRINLGGVFHCCRAVVPCMRSQNYGRIVSIASVAGKEGNPNASAYSASKAGVINLTRSLGKELARTGICVNAITPGVIETEMLDDVADEQIDYMVSKIPMGRMGTVDEIAEMVLFLSSESCSFSTAAVFDMSGGRTTY